MPQRGKKVREAISRSRGCCAELEQALRGCSCLISRELQKEPGDEPAENLGCPWSTKLPLECTPQRPQQAQSSPQLKVKRDEMAGGVRNKGFTPPSSTETEFHRIREFTGLEKTFETIEPNNESLSTSNSGLPVEHCGKIGLGAEKSHKKDMRRGECVAGKLKQLNCGAIP